MITVTCDDKTGGLPDEILVSIFKLLPLESLLSCEKVCQRWRTLSQDLSVWRDITIIYSGKPGLSDISEQNLEVLRTHSDLISCVKIQYVYNYSFITSIINNCDNLISIELVMCRVHHEFPEDLKKWPSLKKLNLKNSLLLRTIENDTDALLPFDHFKNLTYLALADFGLSIENCKSLTNCHHLKHIYIEKIKDLDKQCVKALILGIKENVETLHIYGGDAIDDKCVILLSQCKMLHDLAIIRCESLTDIGLLPLANLKNLDHVQLWNNNNFTESALLSTLKSPTFVRLKSLSLSRIKNVSPMIVDVVSEYKELKFLALYQCPKIINTDYEKQLKSKFRNIDVVLY